ncbi:helix-turn-helix domain-containing protein [Bradyrhizobium neotropicale]|uniref:helix-turn-helix domain-containing protein n=1 Tax=Bradyrhizobium neotropicale TaxID=1497615 RepID=UPI00390811AC
MTTRADNARGKTSLPSLLVRFLTRKEAARELRMSLAKLDRVIARGELRAKKHGHSTFVMASEIERYIAQWPDVKPRAERGAL